MTRKELARIVAKKLKINLKKAEKLIICLGTIVGDELAQNKKITYSNFGTFYTVHYPSKVINHPKYGSAKKMVMLPTDVVKWMPAANIKSMVNLGTAVESPTTHGRTKVKKEEETIITKPEIIKPTLREIEPQTIIKNDENIKKNNSEDDDEEIEIPIRTQKTVKKASEPETKEKKEGESDEKSVNIYEELMNDGSKMESTFKDAIRVHKGSFLSRMFHREKEKENTEPKKESNDKVSLVDAGIFNPADTLSSTLENQKIDHIKTKIGSVDGLGDKPNDVPVSGEQFFGKTEQKVDNSDLKDLSEAKETPIIPFPATRTAVSYIDLSKISVSKEILQRIPEKLARKYKLVPVNEQNGEMTVAMVDPEDIEAREIIKKYINEKISLRLTTEEDLNKVLDQYNGLESELKEAIENADDDDEKEKKEKEKTSVLIESASDDAPAARIVTSLLRRAIREKASDIHIEPTEGEVEVRLRLDGILKKTISLPKEVQYAVVSRIKILSNLKIDEQRLPQDGRFSIVFDNHKVDFRVSTMPIANGEKVVMRVLDKMNSVLTIEKLGIRGRGLDVLTESLSKSHGMILVTGPTGSGKTTTLYALIQRIYNESINIVTLEDPIEYRMPGINQSQVNPEIDYTFASGLRSIVRQDPDVIMIGEIRDSETAEMAVHAALTGHVVFSTLHTNDSAGAAPRILDMGVEPFLLTSSLNCVVAQRLTRKICEDCKEEVKISDIELKNVQAELDCLPEKEKADMKNKKLKFFKGKGCKSCGNSGYRGRIGVYEILSITEELKEMILKKESSFQIEKKAVEQGMLTMIQDGILKCLDGITSLQEVWRVIKE